jgi:Helicase conserved C-terminal domain
VSVNAIHVFADVKENAKTIFNNLFQQLNCPVVTAESKQQEQLQIAEEWFKGCFRVLISTAIGLVGNKNPYCTHIACAGYLHDIMPVIQSIGRLWASITFSVGSSGKKTCKYIHDEKAIMMMMMMLMLILMLMLMLMTVTMAVVMTLKTKRTTVLNIMTELNIITLWLIRF